MTLPGWFGTWFGEGVGGGTVVQPGPHNAGDIIALARKMHPAFSKEAIPVPIAMAMLTVIYHDLHSQGLELDPQISANELAHDLLPTFDGEIDVPAHVGIVSATALFADGLPETARPVEIVGYGDRLRVDAGYRAYEENEKLILVGTADTWLNVEGVVVRYLAAPEPLNDANDSIYLPLSARAALTAALAHQMAVRCEALAIPNVNVKKLADNEVRSVETWLKNVMRAGRPRIHRIQDVM